MALNIKSEEADRLIAALADLTGESKTRAVIVAVKERLDRETKQRSSSALTRELLGIGEKCARYVVNNEPHGDLLYDEDGLPK